MIALVHQQQIKNAASTNDKNIVKTLLKNVLHEELGNVASISDVSLVYIDEIVEHICIPVKTNIKMVDESLPLSQENLSMMGLLKVVAVFLSMSLVCVACVFGGPVVGVVLSLVCTYVYYYLNIKQGGKNLTVQKLPEIKEEVVIDGSTLLEMIDNLVIDLKQLLNQSTSKIPYAIDRLQPLHTSYKEILKWLQDMYADSNSFDESTKILVQSQILSIADLFYYDVVTFNGNNKELFQVKKEIGLNSPKMRKPAIVHQKDAKVILPGILFVPTNFD